MKANYISSSGYEVLLQELKELGAKKKELLDLVSLNREQEIGNEAENNELMRLKQEMRTLTAKEQELAEFSQNCVIVDLAKQLDDNSVRFGNVVTLLNVDTEEVSKYQILGEREADPKNGKISYRSPLGASIIGKETGEFIEINTPSGYVEYEITHVGIGN